MRKKYRNFREEYITKKGKLSKGRRSARLQKYHRCKENLSEEIRASIFT
jgi:hypothetical protein